jgi:protein-S-isoprenylcysteine O-methyltransferase Ste14
MKLGLQAFCAALAGLVFFGICLFVPAGTVNYWQAWVFIAVFTVATIVPSIYLAINDPETLRRRMHAGPTAETRPIQRLVFCTIYVLVVALLAVSALDHRFGWSTVPLWLVVLGDVLVGAGLLLAQWVVIQNRYAAATVRVEQGQRLTTTGLYGLVRHPMYAGALVMMLGTPPALDSLWGLAVVIPAVAVLAVRVLDEEKMLTAELSGYREYTAQVRHRLIPKVW